MIVDELWREVFHQLTFLDFMHVAMTHGNGLAPDQFSHGSWIKGLYDLVFAENDLAQIVGPVDTDDRLAEHVSLENPTILSMPLDEEADL